MDVNAKLGNLTAKFKSVVRTSMLVGRLKNSVNKSSNEAQDDQRSGRKDDSSRHEMSARSESRKLESSLDDLPVLGQFRAEGSPNQNENWNQSPEKHSSDRQTGIAGDASSGRRFSMLKGKALLSADLNPNRHLRRREMSLTGTDSEKIISLLDNKGSKIHFLDSIQHLEYFQQKKIIREKYDLLEKQNEDMKMQLASVQKALKIILMKRLYGDQSGVEELRNLWSQASSPFAEPTIAIITELQGVRDELLKERKMREDLEKQLKENNEELMHIYIDAEETKKQLVDYFLMVRKTKRDLERDKKNFESEKSELQRSRPQTGSVIGQNSSKKLTAHLPLKLSKQILAAEERVVTEEFNWGGSQNMQDSYSFLRPPTKNETDTITSSTKKRVSYKEREKSSGFGGNFGQEQEIEPWQFGIASDPTTSLRGQQNPRSSTVIGSPNGFWKSGDQSQFQSPNKNEMIYDPMEFEIENKLKQLNNEKAQVFSSVTPDNTNEGASLIKIRQMIQNLQTLG